MRSSRPAPGSAIRGTDSPSPEVLSGGTRAGGSLLLREETHGPALSVCGLSLWTPGRGPPSTLLGPPRAGAPKPGAQLSLGSRYVGLIDCVTGCATEVSPSLPSVGRPLPPAPWSLWWPAPRVSAGGVGGLLNSKDTPVRRDSRRFRSPSRSLTTGRRTLCCPEAGAAGAAGAWRRAEACSWVQATSLYSGTSAVQS